MGSETLNTVEKVVLVRLYGKLGRLFGREHRLSVSSVREAIRALCIIIPGFELWLENSQERGITYAIFNGERNISEQDLQLDGVHEVIRIDHRQQEKRDVPDDIRRSAGCRRVRSQLYASGSGVAVSL